MSDMLVKLYQLPKLQPVLDALAQQGIEIRTATPAEKTYVTQWVHHEFDPAWGAECEVAFGNLPITCFIAVKKSGPKDDAPGQLLGFGCYNATRKGMFGPEGVHPKQRGRGIGQALLLACLHAMVQEGYAYAVIGWAGPQEFYAKSVGATVIQGSEPGVYRGKLVGDV